MRYLFYFFTILSLFFNACSKDEIENTDDFSKDSGTFIDERDGNEYKWVKIGDQIWMAENLASGGWVYDNNESNASIYGRLYSWELANNVCPEGWHLPSNQEWEQLVKYIDDVKGPFEESSESAVWNGVGKYLKSKGNKEDGTGLWEKSSSEEQGIDEFGFSGHPGGMRTIQEEGNIFRFIEERGYWWSSSGLICGGKSCAWSWRLSFYGNHIINDDIHQDYVLSVRCIKD